MHWLPLAQWRSFCSLGTGKRAETSHKPAWLSEVEACNGSRYGENLSEALLEQLRLVHDVIAIDDTILNYALGLSVMMEDIVWDRAKGELRIVGKRHLAIDAEALCRHLDALVGPQVAEVIMRNHEFRLGKEDAERHRKEKPNASMEEIIEAVKETDLLSGVGLTKFTVQTDQSVLIEVSNPCVKETAGAAKSLLFGYWSGVLSCLFGKEYDAVDVKFNESTKVLSARLVSRGLAV